MAELEARGLVVHLAGAVSGTTGAVNAVDGVDLRVDEGELVAVMGGTGAGKSTLALALAGLVPTAAGSVSGRSVGEVRVVLQRPEATFLQDRVLDEVSLAARWRGEPAAAAERHAATLLAELGLPTDAADRDPLTLSGGEQRRVAIAAVLAAGARMTILDEPGAGLDARARSELHAALRQLHAAGRTLVVVTHDPAEAATLATRLVVLRAGRVAWDGSVAAVLGDPTRARVLGIDVAPEVRVLHAVAERRGQPVPVTSGRPADAVVQLGQLLTAPARPGSAALAARKAAVSPSLDAISTRRAPLPPLIDARARLGATALAVVAALAAQSLLAAALVATATAFVLAAARVERRRVRLVVRPLVLLAITLVVLQLAFGSAKEVDLSRGHPGSAPVLAALLRSLQATAVALATLALSGATATADLAAGMRRLLGPLRVVRVPVDAAAFVVATGLGLVPTFADELDRLRLAQRARGIGDPSGGPLARLRADTLLLAPLFVAAFRRAHLLADALAVRGFDPRVRHLPWRPRTTPASDVILLVAGIALVAVARLA